MFELMRASGRYGQATRFLERGETRAHYETLRRIFELMTRKNVSRTSALYLSLTMSALTELARHATQRGELDLARAVLTHAKEVWTANVSESPRLTENRSFADWARWVDDEVVRLRTNGA